MSDHQESASRSAAPAKALEYEAAALKEVLAHQARLLAAANAAFQGNQDPMVHYAKVFADSTVVLVRAQMQLNIAAVERLLALGHTHVYSDTPVPMLPFPGVLKLFGVVPVDPSRFRAGAISTVITVLLAAFGLGVIVGKFL